MRWGLRRHLADRLPQYMVPQHYIKIEALPLTANRKTDYKRLPALEVGRSQAPGKAPGTPSELLVAAIWEELLGVDAISTADNFLALGGHSLLTVRASDTDR